LADYRNVNGYACPGEYGVDAVEGLENAFIGIGIPCLSRGDVYAFYAFPFWSFHRSLEEDPQLFYGVLGFGCHPVGETFVEHPFSNFYDVIFQGYFSCLENAEYGVHDFRADPVSFCDCDLHISIVYICFEGYITLRGSKDWC